MQIKKILIAILLVFLLSACNNPTNDSLNEEYGNKNKNTIEESKFRENSNNLLALASFKEFESTSNNISPRLNRNTIIKKVNTADGSINEVKEYLKYSYPFDYVKIHTATKFDLFIPEDSNNEELEVIKLNCGFGNLEVTVAEFTTYIVDLEDYDNDLNIDDLFPSVTDTLISFKGQRGFYTILKNSYALGNDLNFDNGHKYWVFSSHKKITNTEIEKNFEPPIYSIQLEITDDKQYKIAFKKDNDLSSIHDFYGDKGLIQYNVDSSTIKKVSRDTLYKVFDLVSVPEVEQIVEIESIDIENKTIQVISNSDLKIIYIDEYTEYNKETIETTDLWNLLAVGNFISVTYDCYFDGYVPIEVYANSINSL